MTRDKLFSLIYNKALTCLARRDHSRRELLLTLDRQFPGQSEILEDVLDKLKNDGYQCDERFADAYARYRNSRGFGADRIRQELQLKGVSEDLIESVLNQFISAEVDEQSRIFLVWNKKYKELPADFKSKQKQIQYLRYRGFQMTEIELLFDFLGLHSVPEL